MIHKINSEEHGEIFVISSRQMWLPGGYADERAANYAFRFTNRELDEINDRIFRFDAENRPITFEDLQAVRKERKHKPEPN